MKLGLALVDVSRFHRLRIRYGERLLARLFSDAELEYAFRHRDPDPHLAGRLAAKMALRRAVRFPFRYSRLEVIRDQGAPRLLSLDQPIPGMVSLSISHTVELAIAQVIVEEE